MLKQVIISFKKATHVDCVHSTPSDCRRGGPNCTVDIFCYLHKKEKNIKINLLYIRLKRFRCRTLIHNSHFQCINVYIICICILLCIEDI